MDYLIGLDIGTSSVKGVLLTKDGQTAATVRFPFAYKKEDRRIELPPEAYLDTCCSAIRTLAEKASGGNILGICASSASGNLLLLDETGRPLTGIIGWQDQRAAADALQTQKLFDPKTVYRTVGWHFDGSGFPLAQLCYLKKHQPELLRSAGKICMSTEYLYYQLTSCWGISPSAGTPFYLIDQSQGKYAKQILDQLEIPEEKLPPILPCGSVVGRVTKQGAKACGLSVGTPVILGSFDHPSAARGVGVLEEGQMLLSCGTSWVAFYPVAQRERVIAANMLSDPFLYPEGPYAGMTSVPSVSENIQNCIISLLGKTAEPFKTLSSLAAKSQPGAKGLRIDPTNPPKAEEISAFAKEDVARAIMEGTVNLLKMRMDALAAQGIAAKTAVMVGGPSEDHIWISLIEQICGISVKVVHGAYAGAVGAAKIAGEKLEVIKWRYWM